MAFLKFKSILLESYTLVGLQNKVVSPVKLSRFYSTDDKSIKNLKKDKKLAKKVSIIGEDPEHFQTRLMTWTELKSKYDQDISAKEKDIIKVTLTDGKIVEGFSWDTTPLDVAKDISSSLASEAYVANINNVLWDMERPLEADCSIKLLKFDSADAKAALWVTAAFTLAEALERLYIEKCGLVSNVGSTKTSFFADLHLKDENITKKEIAAIEEKMSKIFTIPHDKVQRIEVAKSDANNLFAYNPYKLQVLKNASDNKIPIYRCGQSIEISNTPLIRHDKKIRAFKVFKIESISQNGMSFQRIHGTAFPSNNELKEFLAKNKLT